MLEKIIKQIEKELKNNGYRENDNIDDSIKRDIIERSDLKKALDSRFSNRSEVSMEEIHRLSKYSEVRDSIEKYLESNNIILTTTDYEEEFVEDEESDKQEKKVKGYNRGLDVVKQYSKEVHRTELLTQEEEVELFTNKRIINDEMERIRKIVWKQVIKENKNNPDNIPETCKKRIKDFKISEKEAVKEMMKLKNRLEEIKNSDDLTTNENDRSVSQYTFIKGELQKLYKQYQQEEEKASRMICNDLINEREQNLESLPESCRDLIKKYDSLQQKEKEINYHIINANLGLVMSVAIKYASSHEKVLSVSDLIQEGNLGLMKAVERFDITKGFKFSTYAIWWIRQSISRSKADNDRTIRVPVHMVESIYKLKREKSHLRQKLNRNPNNEELAEALHVSVEKVEDIIKYGQDIVSLYATIGEDEDSYLIDYIPDESDVTEENVEQHELRNALMSAMESLSERERNVMILRFGLDGKDPRTLEVIGKEYGVTRERIRQIEAQALRKLRHPSRSRALKDFLR